MWDSGYILPLLTGVTAQQTKLHVSLIEAKRAGEQIMTKKQNKNESLKLDTTVSDGARTYFLSSVITKLDQAQNSSSDSLSPKANDLIHHNTHADRVA